MDKDLTTCVRILADRADELGEHSTAAVLYCLAAYRVAEMDVVMAIESLALAEALKDSLLLSKPLTDKSVTPSEALPTNDRLKNPA
jgi:hypothetical protein